MKYAASFVLMLLCGAGGVCSDASLANLVAQGKSKRVTCFTNGQPMLDVCSTGVVKETNNGFYFQEKVTERLIIIQHTSCVISDMEDCLEQTLMESQ